MADEGPKRPSWLTIGVLGAAASIAIYVFIIGAEIGTMRQQTANQELRITALETHGSGPVQANAEKLAGLTARAERMLTELLAMQQRISELQTDQKSQGVMLHRLQDDMAARPAKP